MLKVFCSFDLTEPVGVDVIRVRYKNVILGGAFAGLAGAYLSLEATNTFQDGMSAGRGFIALAALIVGRWTSGVS